ncbi:MAG: phospholipase [Sulfobacillus benefaciens]|uniref:Phospholipase n=1 Tax=Sulfobacillus benefaciens TaxID=453960 RepID=A0A2T2XCJ3_9FIRM|nr:MAG: phospholipase [Sulfobacillus benefaciens]
MLISRVTFIRASAFLLLVLSGCGTLSIPTASGSSAASSSLPLSPHPAAPRSLSSLSSAPISALILEPEDGVMPWVTLINQARTGIDLNAYLIDNPAILAALAQAGARGVAIHIILAPNPYDDIQAVPSERQALAAIPDVTVRNAPARFDQAYAFDHAKYLVINPGTSHVAAIVGSPNFTDSAFDGTNLEAAVQVTGTAARATAQVFQADWTGQVAGPGPRQSLVLSPGATATWLQLLRSPGRIQVTTEEIGDDPTVLSAMAAKGSDLQLLCPTPSRAAAQSRLATLAQAGVQIRTLSTPYVHAKTIITGQTAFLGSQNLSSVSLHDNRELGVLVSGTDRTALATWFQHWWTQATPWTARSISQPSYGALPTPSTSSPYLPDGDTMTQVRHLWGNPTAIVHNIYDGQPQTVWIYPAGRVDFQQGRVSGVQRTT